MEVSIKLKVNGNGHLVLVNNTSTSHQLIYRFGLLISPNRQLSLRYSGHVSPATTLVNNRIVTISTTVYKRPDYTT